jgi:pyruvate,water dikinase
MHYVYFFGEGHADGGSELRHLVGGKGASLADMTRAGLNVPPGFTISAECCDPYFRAGRQWPEGLEQEVRDNLARLERLAGRSFGRGENRLLVAVRSGAAQSMPGMMDTVLNIGQDTTIEPWEQLRQAVNAVFDSWNSERAVTYRRHHRIDGLLGTAVTVQAMCPSEVSGVLFTANPVNPGLEQILIESCYGLGEALVLGKVTPDRFILDRHSLRVLERTLAPRDGASQASLTEIQIQELARLGLRVEQHYQRPCDIEWGFADGRFYFLQARPIKGLDQAIGPDSQNREQVRREEIAALAERAEPGGTVWCRYNLAEILPEPTPMTWALVRRFMSGRGGFGLMYRDLGFDPDPALDEEGIYDLVCGRPYCNLSREPRMQFRFLPFEHPYAALKADPQKALYPQAVLNPARGTWAFWLSLPWLAIKLSLASGRLRKHQQTFAERFRRETIPTFDREICRAMEDNLTGLETPALLQRLEHWVGRTLYEFARDSLKPTALAGASMDVLRGGLAGPLGTERARTAVGELVMGVRPDPEADLSGAVRELTAGRLDLGTFQARFGHRSSREMELAYPRWSEDPAAVRQIAPLSQGQADLAATGGMYHGDAWQRIAEEARLSGAERDRLEAELQTLHTCLSLRETGKHYLMKGYALIRRTLLEIDRRFDLQGGVFFLTPEELPRLAAGEDLSGLIAERCRRRTVALSLEVPQVLFSDDLEAIGRPPPVLGAAVLHGVPVSAGTAEGTALVLEDPADAGVPSEPYILVCPSTDPAWVPLFIHARGLVMETGGVLSHGAIVAREFGLPAVAGLADVHRRLRTGQRLHVDGGSGVVTVLSNAPQGAGT